ncbi:unnamed protein product, partial [Arctia plantaginis]
MSARKKSSVWTFYTESDQPNKVKCILCDALISHSGSGRSASTFALTNHLRVKHDREYTQLQHLIHSPNPILPSVRPTSSNTTEELPAAESSLRQATIEGTFERKWKIDDPRAKQIHKAIAEMICVDNQPISIVEDAGFNRLLAILKPKYQMPSPKFITETYLIKEEVKVAFSNINTMFVRRSSLKEGLDRRCQGIEDDKYYSVATMLDPRYKMNFFTPDNVQMIRRTCLAEFVRRSEDIGSSGDERVVQVAQRSTSSSNCENTHRTFWSCYEELAAVKLPIDVEETKSPIASELDRYLSEVLLLKDLCPYG